MKNLFSASTLAAVFLAFAVTGVQADQKVKRSKSNVTNNKSSGSQETDVDCGGAADCASADGMAPPRDAASGQATGKRMHKPVSVSESKPMAPKEASSSSQGTGEASSATSSAPAGTASEGCCPGRCCPPEGASDIAIGDPGVNGNRESPTKQSPVRVRESPSKASMGGKAKRSEAKNTLNAIDKTTAQAATGTTAGTSGSDNPPPADNFVYPILPADVTHLKEMPVDDSIRLTPR